MNKTSQVAQTKDWRFPSHRLLPAQTKRPTMKSRPEHPSYFARKGIWQRILFALLYFAQLGGSVVFLRWLFTDAWNQNFFMVSFLFACAEVIAFVSTALWLFSGLFALMPSNSTEINFFATSDSDLDPTKHDCPYFVDQGDDSSDSEPKSDGGKIVRFNVDGEVEVGVGLESQPFDTVAVCVCRYREPLEDLLQTVECMNSIESAHNVQLYILDDGWYSSTEEQKLAQLDGLKGVLGTKNEHTDDEFPTFQTTPTIYRPDCASECRFLTLQSNLDGMKRCTLIARKKPSPHCHYKAGNLNNFLYNFLGYLAENNQDVPSYMLMLDHDMLPHHNIVEDALFSLQSDLRLAFVQYPQRFHDLRGPDLIHAGNEVFFDGVQINRGHIGLAAFAGTNVVWRVQALLHVGGLQYNTLTEDNSTGFAVHRLGYTSMYSDRELAVGQSPQTVKAAMQQRMRWSQGAIEILLNTVASCFKKPQSLHAWESPALSRLFARDVPVRPSLARRFVVFLVYLDSMIYPFYSLGFILHFAVCVLYLATTEAPISAEDPRAILVYWLPLYGVKYSCQLLAFSSVSFAAQWTSQMAWAGYSLSTVVSVFQAIWLRVFNTRGTWFNTGAKRHDFFYLQYGNTAIAALIYLMIVYRGFAFVFIDKTCDAWVSVGSILYGFVLMFHIQGWAAEPIKAFVRTKKVPQRTLKRLLDDVDSKTTPEDSFSSKKSSSLLSDAFEKARGHRDQHHSMDFSILFVVSNVALFTFILFFWAENNCDFGSMPAPEAEVVEVEPPDIFTSPLPHDAQFDVEFIAKDRKLYLNDKEFKIKGGNWFGFETELNGPFGLYDTTQDAVLHRLVENGFNALRLPLAAGSVLNPLDHLVPNEGTIGGGSNSHLNISSYIDLVETFIDRTASWGVFTLLDIHRLRNDKDNTPYPFDDITTFDDLKDAWTILAEQFCTSWSVMGADLMNEPWNVTWGDDSPYDWRVLAAELAETVLSACPKWLIFIEGQWILDKTISPVNTTDFAPWGGVFTPAADYPIKLSNPSKLIYSPHVYGPGSIGNSVVWAPNRDEALLLCQCAIRSPVIDEMCQRSRADHDSHDDDLNVTLLRQEAADYCTNVLPLPHQPYPHNMPNVWDFTFGFLKELNYTVIIGEWGGTYVNPTYTNHGQHRYGTDGPDISRELEIMWNHELVKYLAQNDFSSFYWSVNPESSDTGGILLDDWKTIDPAKQWLLENIKSSNPLSYLGDIVPPDALDQCLEDVGVEILSEKFGGDRYKRESLAYNRALDSDRKRPRAIVFPVNEKDVQNIVQCAKASSFKVCARSGGYSYVGDSTCNGVLVDLRHMKQLEAIDEERYIVGPGISLGALAQEMSDRGRIVPTGNHNGIGMGWFLGCGYGFLSRAYGLGCDIIISATVVTGTGELIEVRESSHNYQVDPSNTTGHGTNDVSDSNSLDQTHPDLMWALRGIGSSQLGIVTSIQIQTYPMPNEIQYFRMIWPREKAAAALEMWQNWGLNHPNHNFSARMSVWSPSEEPTDFNDWYDGVHLDGLFIGGKDELNELLVPPVDVLGSAALDERRNMTYTRALARIVGITHWDELQLQVPYIGYSGPRRWFRNSGHLIKNQISQQDISIVTDLVNTTLPGAKIYQSYLALSPIGGATASPRRPSAFGHRDTLAIAQHGGYWDNDPSREDSVIRHQLKFRHAASKIWGNDAFYNYKENDLMDWEAAYWGKDNVPKIRQLKCRYDPLGLFSTAEAQNLVCAKDSTLMNEDIKTDPYDCDDGLVMVNGRCAPSCVTIACPANSSPNTIDGCADSVDECDCEDGYAKNGNVCVAQIVDTPISCGLMKVELEDVKNFPSGSKLELTNGFNSYLVDGSDAFSILATTYGVLSRVEFTWNDEQHTERFPPFYMNGETNYVPQGVPYLHSAGLKYVTMKGCGDDLCELVCFETTFSLAASY